MTGRKEDEPEQYLDDGRQGMTDRYQGRHRGITEAMDEVVPACICPKCGYVISYDEESPCAQQSCPHCGSGLDDYTEA